MGLHPHLVEERHSEMPLFEGLLGETRYVGEVGLDAGPRFFKTMPRQTTIFRRVLALCAEHGHKVLSVHSVRTASQVLYHVEELLPQDRGKVVLHWFSGTPKEAKRAAELGCYFSINQAMLERDRSRNLVGTLPPSQLLTETDGPFIEGENGAIGPGDVTLAVERLSSLLELSYSDTQRLIVQNFANLVS
ncbi:Qat anti-phage system TatD family nuclease QatD [Devosia sp. A369]